MSVWFKRALLASAIGLAACGGGGDDPAPEYLAGTYNGSYTRTQDNCATGAVGANNQQVVSVNGSDITVQVGSFVLTGGAREDGGLSAVYQTVSNGITTKVTVTYAMPEGVTAPGNGTFNSELLIQTYADPKGFTCNVRLNGQVVKVG